MGQRSQIYVIAKEDGRYYLTANYYPWNYGERMISRVRGTLEQIVDDYLHYTWYLTRENLKLRRIMDVNWDMHDIILSSDIVKEFDDDYEEYWKEDYETYAESFFDIVFCNQDNNNGQCYIYVDCDVPEEERKVKLAFTNSNFEESELVDAETYLNKDMDRKVPWDQYMTEHKEYYDEETVEYTKDNIKYINEHSELMSKDELHNILVAVSACYQETYEFLLNNSPA